MRSSSHLKTESEIIPEKKVINNSASRYLTKN